MSSPIPTSSVAAKVAQIIEGLRFTVPKFIAKDRNAGPLIMLIWSHLGRLGRQFAALAARAEAGTLRIAQHRRAVTPGVGTPRVRAARVPSGLPTGWGWMGDMMWETRGWGGSLQQIVLEDPEMAALIAACPQAGRIVRSILWMTLRSPVPAILRVSRPKRARASSRPLREASPSSSNVGETPPSVPPSRGGMQKASVPLARGGRQQGSVLPSLREVRFWSQPRGKLRSTAGPPSGR